MLVRLQSTIGRNDLIEQMVLLPEPKKTFGETIHESCLQPAKSVNLIVAYNSSPNSHTALDIALWIAHQTRLATNAQVTVQAVYVIEDNQSSHYPNVFRPQQHQSTLDCPISDVAKSAISVLTEPKLSANILYLQRKSADALKQADKIIWQARSLAEEWQASFKTHLRFGSIAAEIKNIVELEAADILFVGCQSRNHPMIQALGSNFPCAVLGIPNCIDE
jgi:nucleotide-binding universal stress UspA family protein